jgi:ABC-2 type transport system permease protein
LIADLRTVMWKEWKELLAQRGQSLVESLGLLVVLAFLGLFFPIQYGPAWLETPVAVVLAAWMPLLLVASVVCDSIAGERERHTLETLLASRLSTEVVLLGKIAGSVAYGWGFTLATLTLSIVGVNVAYGGGRVLLPVPEYLLGTFLLSLLTSILASAAGVLVSLRSSTVRQAQQAASLGAMGVFLIPMIVWKSISEEGQARFLEALVFASPGAIVVAACGVLAVLDLVLLGAAATRFRRSHLVLD